MAAVEDRFLIRESHHSPFVREFIATPWEPMHLDFETTERKNGRYIDATYAARVDQLRLWFAWDDEGKFWWGQASQDIHLVNSQTNDRYRTGWRAERINQHFGPHDSAPDHVAELMAALKPHTTITVIEQEAIN